jgi:choloylglycine hydrolase
VAFSQNAFQGASGVDAVREAFHILDSFDIPKGIVRPAEGEQVPFEYTQWTSASDLKNRRYYFHTYEYRRIRAVELTGFNLDADRPVRIPLNDEGAIETLEAGAGDE